MNLKPLEEQRQQFKRTAQIKKDHKAMSEGKANVASVRESSAFLPNCGNSDNTYLDELRHVLLASINLDPISYSETMSVKEKVEWQKAVDHVLNSIEENQGWIQMGHPTVNIDGSKANIIIVDGSLKEK